MPGRNRLFRLASATAVALLAINVFSHWFQGLVVFRTLMVGIDCHAMRVEIDPYDPTYWFADIWPIRRDDRVLIPAWRPVHVINACGEAVDIPLWNFTAAAIIIAAAAKFRRRRPQGCCNSCGYNLTGNVSGCCPECGEPATGDPLLPREER